ncbi:MAG: helix-turn-helix domain-containing protein [Firmicutes bacterium]|nr:helix-turn-helix domain-containing protein [Bacillota bacterium]
MEGLCSVKEACAFLSIGKSSLYNLMRKGRLPFIYIGSNRKIPRVALIEFTERALEEGRASLSS